MVSFTRRGELFFVQFSSMHRSCIGSFLGSYFSLSFLFVLYVRTRILSISLTWGGKGLGGYNERYRVMRSNKTAVS